MMLDFNTLYPYSGRWDRLFDDLIKSTAPEYRRMAYPPLNISEDEQALHVRCQVPGMSMDDLELTLTDKSLVIKGERRAEEGKFYRQERPVGTFQRVVRLNVPVDREKIKATLRDGVLTVTLPRAEEARPRRISIEAS
ncbi:HSP20 family protein [Paucidesulfovibrio gracilis DSM 16080]|uniref:HSP20 family protein n=1 Tax=Paucidesulfovibrio gracilis DSM 16080 TaxID=1121449 RepID=A0A1T4Y5B8_9BACT|nr:Hsp20/alpha crystallin family protein [Paucidesulfovibrio gracilis]SKA96833.1 HSP20 family protein [Paucidesulfovibrio gracilis DSM 16080]